MNKIPDYQESWIKTVDLPKVMTTDEKLSIDINRIQVSCRRLQYTYLRPAFIFEHCFAQVRIQPWDFKRL